MIDVFLKSVRRIVAFGLPLLLLAGSVAAEPGAGGDLTPGQEKLANRYIEAVAAQDLAALKELYHPEAFTCIDEENRPFNDMENWLQRHFSVAYGPEVTFRGIPYAVMSESADAVLASQPSLPIHSLAEGWTFAVAPSHQVIIFEKSSDPEEPSGLPMPKTKLLMVERQDAWWLTYACVEPQGRKMQEYIQSMTAKAERANNLYQQLDTETKQQLKEVVAADGDVDKQARFTEILQQATGETDTITLNLLATKAYGELLPAVMREKLAQ